MPKKRFSTQYSKPQSTVHPSLSSSSSSLANPENDVPLTVEELILSSRRENATPGIQVTTSQTPSLPPQIRHLLSEPELPVSGLRSRRNLEEHGRRLPAGPAPPRSWVERSRNAPESSSARRDERARPTNIHHLPGLRTTDTWNAFRTKCLRASAEQWEVLRVLDQHRFAEKPTKLHNTVRMDLLSFIAVYGPDDGVGFEGLRNLLLLPEEWEKLFPEDSSVATNKPAAKNSKRSKAVPETPPEDWDAVASTSTFDPGSYNDDFFRVDLSGAMGDSISFKQLSSLFESPGPSLSAILPRVTHLSLSHPSQTVSWRSLLALSKHIPTLTHLSLAYWPVPTLTPNARTAVMSSQTGRDVQYGGTNYYSHTVDNDFSEAADVLRRLASNLYSLEYLDVSGCSEWFRAIRWTGPEDEAETTTQGIDWSTQFLKLTTLKMFSPRVLITSSSRRDVTFFVQSVREVRSTQKVLNEWMVQGKRLGHGQWIDVEYDDFGAYRDLWRENKVREAKEKRYLLMAVLENRWGVNEEASDEEWATRLNLPYEEN